MRTRTGQNLTPIVVFAAAFTLGAYFTFAAVQGDFGLFRRAEILDEVARLEAERDMLLKEVHRLENITLRLSDDYLDLDLLDQQARDILGLARADELIVR